MSLAKEALTLPNLLSMLRLALVPVFLVLLLQERYLSSLVVLALGGITDYLDGYFARRWNQVTRLGQLLDPAADRLYIFSSLIGLVYTGFIPIWLAGLVISRDVLLFVVYPVLATHGYGPLPVHYLGKAGTFTLLYAFPLLLMAKLWTAAEFVILPLAWAFALWGVGLYWWAGFVYLRQVVDVVKNSEKKNHVIEGGLPNG
ncbi:CDP-alcohol phosphatidyltransferase family protein [Candidatus Rhodoluna planktonica]|uniref:CDP-diacylglycerol--glycerol-3-phosphate 3-phosphatidyltransferase n=1 Tax=Candidatus Rhodoluna planktonica TaxID=535712 RepID=A0A1D9DZE6_9MICO|nr:CDP-alcohol phosphatidyltransferase family protein [Candidatus Rhodoluna planktonica]AOY56188.1 CDP-diacylglycerol--glycerol-3-phosphate 3-phosphatidyltransferase [Candidatus Rhodoluna planktonica]